MRYLFERKGPLVLLQLGQRSSRRRLYTLHAILTGYGLQGDQRMRGAEPDFEVVRV